LRFLKIACKKKQFWHETFLFKNTSKDNLSVDNYQFEISGPSFSENIYQEIYEKILNWTENEMPKIDNKINCIFNISILNSLSYKNILQILILFTEYQKKGKEISITWYFEGDDEDNEELAQDLSQIFDIPFTIKAV